jgi:protein gp37
MGEKTSIPWSNNTFNVVWGCVEVSEACVNCYAREWAHRQNWQVWGRNANRRIMSDQYWEQPYKWNKRAERNGVRETVFCSSMADWAENHPVVNEQRQRLWPLIKATPWLDWLLLTKRIDAGERLPEDWGDGYPNAHIGMTMENTKRAMERIGPLLAIPAVTHWMSCEPQLDDMPFKWLFQQRVGKARIDWAIFGGESGEKHRPCRLDFMEKGIRNCREFDVAPFMKQCGTSFWTPRNPKEFTGVKKTTFDMQTRLHRVWLDDVKGENWDQWPEQLRVREFPITFERVSKAMNLTLGL